MELTPVNVINQMMSWLTLIAMEFVFINREADTRKHIAVRVITGNIMGIAYMMTYFPFYEFAKGIFKGRMEAALIYIWWGVFYFSTIFLMHWWFKMSYGQIMLRCIMAMCLYSAGTTLIQNFIAGIWLPGLMEKDMMLYLAVYVGCYVVLGFAGYMMIVRNMGFTRELYGMDTPMAYGFFSLLLVFCNIVWDVSNGIFRHTIEPLLKIEQYDIVVVNVQYFCALTSIVFSFFVLGILFLSYRISWLRQEESMLRYLQNEKEKQYEYSRQNMDIINQKCHDLKRQIQALRFSEDAEKEKLYQETQEAADFFNYVVKTDNEMLNTILTEKGLICHNKRIRLTCTVRDCRFESISVIDLYTIFSNAIDNAIECVEQYEEDKRIITIHLSMIGQMNCIMIDNYFDGELNFADGQLVTSKEDKNYHGFGVRSIQMLTKKYKGDVRISHENHTFSLQIMLPS